MNFKIRKALPEDAEALHSAHMKSIQEVCSKDYSHDEINAWGNQPYNEKQRKNAITNDLVWIIEDNGHIEGFSHFMVYEKEGLKLGYILGLYLTPRVLGKKIGKSILELMIIEAKKVQVKSISLEATITAHIFYQRMGFLDSGPQTLVEINGQKIRCYPMKMTLDH